MQPALNKLKDVTNKLEKYYYTRTIFRQHGYFQLYSLSSLLGLLVQVPFFLAAYWMLLSYPPIKGVSFGPIKDLSLPDNLLSIRGFTINFLPFLMTAANLIAGVLYSKKKILAERLQLIVISLIFLVLLYNLPAVLVLYWTMNNIFSIGKNWLIQKNIINQIKFHRYISSKWKNNKYMISPILFSIFPLLSLYIENIGELYFSKIISYLFAIIPSTVGILLLSKFIFKDRYKAVIFCFILIVLFFSFGHLFNTLTISVTN